MRKHRKKPEKTPSTIKTPENGDGLSQQARNSTLRDYGAGASKESALVSDIHRKMNQHFDSLMHAVEGLSARLTQLETRVQLVENSVDDLKASSEINHGRTDGKLRQLENIPREVECGMQDLRDKQDISEAQLQPAKFQMIKDQQKFENRVSNAQTTLAEGVSSSTPQQSQQLHSSRRQNRRPIVSIKQLLQDPDGPIVSLSQLLGHYDAPSFGSRRQNRRPIVNSFQLLRDA